MNSYKIELMNSSHVKGVFEVSKLSLAESWNIDSIEKELSNKLANILLLYMETRLLALLECGLFFMREI